jgi:hypothetical protein
VKPRKTQQEIAELEAAFEQPAYWRCAHCNEPITGNGYTWTGPLRKPGESVWDQKRYHLSKPECQRACAEAGKEA